MRHLNLGYPHVRDTRKPVALSAPAIWSIATEARRQIVGHVGYKPVEPREIIDRVRLIEVNGVPIETVWDRDNPVYGSDGMPVLGLTEHDGAIPDAVKVAINGELVAGKITLLRGTACHELGHLVFDGPAWVYASRQLSLPGLARQRQVYRVVTAGTDHFRDSRTPDGRMDWAEFRANEFMGAFLLPLAVFAHQLTGLADAARLPKLARTSKHHPGAPVLDRRRADPVTLEAVQLELAERFGVSLAFVRQRMLRYDLISPPGANR